MRRVLAIALFVIIFISQYLIIVNVDVETESKPSLKYYIKVYESGNATVKIVFISNNNGSAFLYLPKFEPWKIVNITGKIIWINHSQSFNPFYTNSSFNYFTENGIFNITISFNFPYASLITEDKAWFMTPLIGTNDYIDVKVEVFVDNFKSLLGKPQPDPIKVEENHLSFELFATSQGKRVAFNYYLLKSPEEFYVTRKINNITVKVKTIPYYSSFANKILDVLEKSLPYLNDIFGKINKDIEFRLFLPKGQVITALGYVLGEDINLGGEGPIYLNLALIRFVEGYLESTVIHEYIHKALGALGVEANSELRWFHEGIATYVSLYVCKCINVSTKYLEENREEAFDALIQKYDGELGFVQFWQTGSLEGDYYLAAEYIITYLAKKYGGISYIKQVIKEIRLKGGLKNTDDIIEVLNKASGEDLRPQFKEWGFIISEVTEEEKDTSTLVESFKREYIILIAIMLGILLLITFILVYKRLTEEKKIILKTPPPEESTVFERYDSLMLMTKAERLKKLEEYYEQGLMPERIYKEIKRWLEEE